ncbi:cytochrome b5-like heme/steroid binding domain-containing protein [Mycotypha africana]|uniref:cytochrome b5-like heme/steroid binding domain-containing protein n=1 Tax=Mycotypha africana TaxID=64632 RepID=UPI002301C2BD|nr:cytochrome b5-like heme/steroid binding domain-containing protein [Mycotypha africana]KAI8970117.1 cytochrome b5-like heme/steroid binding domain-containing protein [Mycotypha africana]
MATAEPKATPITVSELAKHDGSDPSLPIYVAIKGDVFDVSKNTASYGPGAGYNVFAGKDSSKALGMSSLKPEDCVGDYSGLTEKQMETLNQWHEFFSKRYNIVGKVVPDN